MRSACRSSFRSSCRSAEWAWRFWRWALSSARSSGEKQSGTAAWVLSKPTSRLAFVLSRFIALAAGSTAIIVALQSVVAFVHIGVISGQWPDPALFAASAGLVVAYVLFALALTLMLGAFCKTRGAVIGIAIGILLGQQLLGSFVGPIGAFFPVAIGQVASGIALGQPLTSYSAIATAVVLTIVFVGAAVWRFSRDEL